MNSIQEAIMKGELTAIIEEGPGRRLPGDMP